jgi:hypothetical protein
LVSLGTWATPLQAQILSTDFSGSNATLTLPYVDANDSTNNGNRVVSRIGFAWTSSDNTKLSLRALDTLVMGNYTWGSTGTPISSGAMFLTLTGGQWNTGTNGGGNNSNMRVNNPTDPTWSRYQFNVSAVGTNTTSPPANRAVYNLLFEVGASGAGLFDSINFSLCLGTAQTSGAWDNNTLAGNGDFNIRVSNVSVSGQNGTLGSQVAQTGALAIGAGAGPTVSTSLNLGSPLAAGVYLLQIEHFNKTNNQRSSIGDFSMTAVPEPSTWALLALGLTAMVVFRRRRTA